MNNAAPNFIFPPRAEYKINPENIFKYDNGTYYGQPKLNGDATVMWLHQDGSRKVWNRHGIRKAQIDYGKVDLNPLHRGNGWMALAGEYMIKSKNGEDGQLFNHKFCIWDIMAIDGKTLEGTTVEQRVELIRSIYECSVSKNKHLLDIKGAENCFVIPSYEGNFTELYNELVQTDMYEGFLLKLKKGKLQPGLRESNNASWQIKARKETNNYKF